MMTLTLLLFGENIEIEASLLWPALLVLGIHAREMEGGLVEGRYGADGKVSPNHTTTAPSKYA